MVLVVKQEVQEENVRSRKRMKSGREECKTVKKKPVISCKTYHSEAVEGLYVRRLILMYVKQIF
jgi:hypothetical protein